MYILAFPCTYDSLATKWPHSQCLFAPSYAVDTHWTVLSPSTITAGHHCSVSMGPYSIFKGKSFGSSGQVVPGHTMPHFRGKAKGKSGEVGAHVPLLWTAHIWSRSGDPPKKTYRWLTNTWKDAQHHSYQRNVNQNHNEVSSHASQNGCYPKINKQ